MLCARVINGIGTGYLNAIVPVWSAEVANHKSRGAFIAMEFTLVSLIPMSPLQYPTIFPQNIFGVVVAYWLEVRSHSLYFGPPLIECLVWPWYA